MAAILISGLSSTGSDRWDWISSNVHTQNAPSFLSVASSVGKESASSAL
jgi:hypothetical protein